jgi:hypothetical protein
MTGEVFLLTHTHVLPGEQEDVKLIGVFSSRERAQGAVLRARMRPGFANAPEGFHVQRYEIDKEHWAEGFFTYAPPASKRKRRPASSRSRKRKEARKARDAKR